MEDGNKLLITPVVGFSPHIGTLVATMHHCRATTIRWVQDLTVAQLDYLWDENAKQ